MKVVDKLELAEPRTRFVVEMLKMLQIEGSVTIVLGKSNFNVQKAARNIPGVEVVSADSLDTNRILKNAFMVIARDALERLSERLQRVA